MRDSDKQQNDTQESEKDGLLDDLMKQFQQLIMFHSSSTPGVFPIQQQQQQCVAINMNLMSQTLSVLPFMSRMNVLHPVALLEEALDAIPMNNKAELMMALQVAPCLVAHELDPMQFLVFHEYNAQQAMEGLAYNWKIHQELFGD